MYRRMVNFLRGSVALEVESPCPERVVNLCAAHRIPFWNLRWSDETHLTLCTTRRGFALLRTVSREVPGTIRPVGERGVPALLRPLRRRWVLLGALAALVLLLFYGNFFIWELRVSGNGAVPEEKILRALEHYGLRVGTPVLSIDQEDIRNHVLLELEDLSWLAVNVKGCVAHVQAVERLRPPRAIREDEICNVVARCPGLVERVEALGGLAQVAAGSTVTEGQLLISGVADTGGVTLYHGMGQVWARTWHELSALVPLTAQTSEKTENRWKISLDFGKERIKLYGKGSMTGVDCDKIIHYTPVTLPGGLRLPVTVVAEELTAGRRAAIPRSEEEARREGEAVLLGRLSRQLPEGSSITRTRFAAARQGSWLLVTLKAECREDIARQVVLPAPEP